jgi:zinc transporter 11
MIAGYSPEIQAIFGTLFTWGLTAAGSALVFFMRGTQVLVFSVIKVVN